MAPSGPFSFFQADDWNLEPRELLGEGVSKIIEIEQFEVVLARQEWFGVGNILLRHNPNPLYIVAP